MKKFIINILGVVAFALWFYFEPSWESGATTFVAFLTLISQFFWNNGIKSILFNRKKIGKMSQKGGARSTQYQSVQRITVNTGVNQSNNALHSNTNSITKVEQMSQKSGDDSEQYQSGGDMIINK